MTKEYIFVIIGMALVTYIPRMIPMVILKDIELPLVVTRFLKYVPYAALGALIFPGILTSTGSIESALAGGTIAIILAFYRTNLVVVIFGAISTVYLWQLLV